MRPSNTVIVRGRIAREIALEQTSGGTPACQLTVAVNRPRRQDAAEETDFIPCRSYGRTAEFISKYFTKGDPIAISGEFRVDQWTDQSGGKRSRAYVFVEQAEFSGGPRRTGDNTAAPAARASATAARPAPVPISDDDDLPF